ncbi:DUF1269 domain-containing protein [Paracoccus sp. 11-3]|uniref:DUF1269 domain-containing protein n=1 Tax=Paracoccus amoyensis TaxID=2760093 RepID=A0A926G843_9RHOB|nr:DUF1269 domain-containing protein [Paracoccus amoyensis]MBC9247618.1 DUF1269 domain-containing protein [Paracoccus amoyensis]
MSRNIIVVTWPEESKAYQVLSELRSQYPDSIYQAGVAERAPDGSVSLKDGDSNTVDAGTLTGSALGGLIGILGGPLGVLLGFSAGALMGSLVDLNSAVDDDAVLSKISAQLLPGSTALFVDLDENDPSIIDTLVAASGGVLARYDYNDVLTEIISAEDAARAAADEAARVLREEKHAERKADLEKKWEETKSRFTSFFKSDA